MTAGATASKATAARRAFRDLLKWQMERQPRALAAARGEPPLPAAAASASTGEALKATWIGHSTVLLQTAGLNILTDPFLSARASPVPFAGPRRVRPAGADGQRRCRPSTSSC